MSATPLTLAEFETLTGSEFTAFIASNPELADEILDEGARVVGQAWGLKRSTGHLAWVGHTLTRLGASSTSPTSAGPVTSKKIAELSITYAVTAGSSNYGSTQWGQLFEELEARVHPGPTVAAVGHHIPRSGQIR